MDLKGLWLPTQTRAMLILELSSFLVKQLAIPIENGSVYDVGYLWRAFFFFSGLFFKPINLLLKLLF